MFRTYLANDISDQWVIVLETLENMSYTIRILNVASKFW
jgi:hypothetical protein